MENEQYKKIYFYHQTLNIFVQGINWDASNFSLTIFF